MGLRKSLREAFLRAAGDYMLVETPLARADVCIVFGNNTQAEALARHAAGLYHGGYFDSVVVSGGVPMRDGVPECECMRATLLACGVPAERILVEDRAANTGENVCNVRDLLRRAGAEPGSILAVGAVHASRRFLMTLEARWPGPVKMFTAPETFPVPPARWREDACFRAAVLRECRKIAPYKRAGFIREVDMRDLRRRAGALPGPRPPKGFSPQMDTDEHG